MSFDVNLNYICRRKEGRGRKREEGSGKEKEKEAHYSSCNNRICV